MRDSQAYKDQRDTAAVEELETMRDRGRSLATVAWVSIGLGAAVAVATAIWWWVGDETPSERPAHGNASMPATLSFSW